MQLCVSLEYLVLDFNDDYTEKYISVGPKNRFLQHEISLVFSPKNVSSCLKIYLPSFL